MPLGDWLSKKHDEEVARERRKMLVEMEAALQADGWSPGTLRRDQEKQGKLAEIQAELGAQGLQSTIGHAFMPTPELRPEQATKMRRKKLEELASHTATQLRQQAAAEGEAAAHAAEEEAIERELAEIKAEIAESGRTTDSCADESEENIDSDGENSEVLVILASKAGPKLEALRLAMELAWPALRCSAFCGQPQTSLART